MAQTTQPSAGAETGASAAIKPTGAVALWRSRMTGAVGAVGKILNPPAVAANGAKAGAATRPKSGTSRFFFGMLVFLLGSQLLATGLSLLDGAVFHGSLQGTTVAAHSVPLLGGLSWFLLLYMAITIGFWALLYRFKIIPRDPFGMKAQATARAAQARPTVSAGRTRAARRGLATTDKVVATPRRVVSGEADSAYERVKAAQRARRRREGRH